MDLSLQIDRVSDIDPIQFEKKYLNPQKPLLIKGGLLKESPALRKWTPEYFKQTMGSLSVPLYDTNSSKWKDSACTEPDLWMSFEEYIDLISKDEPSNLRMFLFNGFKANPSLKKEFPCPNHFKGVLSHLGYMFFGGKGAEVRMHQDIDMSNVLLTQFAGLKKVVLFSPTYSTLLYRTPLNTFSIANFANPDYDQFPGLRYVKGYELIMEPGDSLFIPSGYWHGMTYLEGGFAVSYRKMTGNENLFFQGLLYMTLYMAIDKVMNKWLKNKWVDYKHKIAIKNAGKAIAKIHSKDGKRRPQPEYLPGYS